MAEADIIFGSVAIRRHSQGQREPLGGHRRRAADGDQRLAGKLSSKKCARIEVTMVERGMTAEQALLAGTRNAAQAIGAADRLGTLEPGKLADLIIVDGEPDATSGSSRMIRAHRGGDTGGAGRGGSPGGAAAR